MGTTYLFLPREDFSYSTCAVDTLPESSAVNTSMRRLDVLRDTDGCSRRLADPLAALAGVRTPRLGVPSSTLPFALVLLGVATARTLLPLFGVSTAVGVSTAFGVLVDALGVLGVLGAGVVAVFGVFLVLLGVLGGSVLLGVLASRRLLFDGVWLFSSTSESAFRFLLGAGGLVVRDESEVCDMISSSRPHVSMTSASLSSSSSNIARTSWVR